MNEQRREIARKYLLPERPFLHGMASAFDMFGVLNRGKSEQLLANLQEEIRRSDTDIAGAAWRRIARNLLYAVDQYETANGEGEN